jgi:hypothetical protein
LICLTILALFYYWFGIADRYGIFLYGHLAATPFDEATSSRYWMAGLVVGGIILVVYTIVNWLLGRLALIRYQCYSPPSWPHVWLLCATPLTAGILSITMVCELPKPKGVGLLTGRVAYKRHSYLPLRDFRRLPP